MRAVSIVHYPTHEGDTAPAVPYDVAFPIIKSKDWKPKTAVAVVIERPNGIFETLGFMKAGICTINVTINKVLEKGYKRYSAFYVTLESNDQSTTSSTE